MIGTLRFNIKKTQTKQIEGNLFMDTPQHQHPYQKPINSRGWVYLDGEMREITVKSISIVGALAQLHLDDSNFSSKRTLQHLSSIKSIDFFLPHLQLSGAAKIMNVDSSQEEILLTLEFENLAYTVDEPVFKRKSYRKEIAIPGKITVKDKAHPFVTVNISMDGLMIRVPEVLPIEKDWFMPFEFTNSDLKGFVKVVWAQTKGENETLVGLQYAKPKPKHQAQAQANAEPSQASLH
jgi:hypothetical protein